MTVNTTKRYSVIRYKFENLPDSPLSIDMTFFGVVERRNYTGGTLVDGVIYEGGSPSAGNLMVVSMELTSSSTKRYLNYVNGTPIAGCVGFQYTTAITVYEGDVLTITMDNVDNIMYTGDVSGNPVTCPRDGKTYLSQWVGFAYTHANKVWQRGVGVRNAKFRGYTENVYGTQQAEK